MCGRFSLNTTGRDLQLHFDLFEAPALIPRYNITPSQQIATIRLLSDRRALTTMKWGLIPRWAKDPAIGNRLSNARAETVAEKPSFRSAFKHRRCLMPASGYFEWRKEGSLKQPYYFSMADARPFAIAGLWEPWHPPEGEPLLTCTLLTTEPNAVAAQVHRRMPVILPEDGWQTWLDPRSDPGSLLALLRPWSGDDLVVHPVSTRVNNARNDDAECIRPIN